MDIIGPAFMAAIGVPVIVPPASLSMRVAVRHKYGIQGSLFEDILVSCFCACCSWCQMAREIKEHKKGCTFITTQPVSIQVQPPTMTTSNVSYMTNQQGYVITGPQSPNQQSYVITGPQSPNQQSYVITGPQSPNQQSYVMTGPQSSSMAEMSPGMMGGPPNMARGGQIKMASDQHAIAGHSQMTTSDPPAYNPAVMMPPDMYNHMVNTTVSTQPSKC
ncbi:uncharacterized protein [Salmo salar]|uniref:Protein PLANT CADMIUM RESISTANCE 2-like n=1 Tax=Salmo salar TaxID=8030 RepID=A0ABM3CHG5_SALSA|nr:uncharacterized protein LOC106563173 [Salmo salar]